MSDRGRFITITLVVLFLVFLGWLLFHGGSKPANQPGTKKVIVLTDYTDTDSAVRFTLDGQINSEEKHRIIRITVGRNSRNIDVLQGYENHLLKSESFANNEAAYNVFLHALQGQSYTVERKVKDKDPTGKCPLGYRYSYELINDTDELQNLWTTTCSGSVTGTFGGKTTTVNQLFQLQIPDYNKFTQDVQLTS